MGSKLKLGVLGSGRGSNFMAIAKNIQAGKLDASIEVVISDKDSKMLATAKEMGLKAIWVNPADYSKEDFNRQLIKVLKDNKIDLVVLAGYMKILSDEFIEAFPNKIINIHPSLLPLFKGLHPQQQALDAGVKTAGCTVHFVIKELDSGKIIKQAVVPVLPGDTEDTLSERILEQEHIIYTQAIQAYASGELVN